MISDMTREHCSLERKKLVAPWLSHEPQNTM